MGNLVVSVGFYRGSGEARGERGVAGINVFNGCSMKRSWWPLWLSRRRTRGWKRSRESRGFHSEGFRGEGEEGEGWGRWVEDVLSAYILPLP